MNTLTLLNQIVKMFPKHINMYEASEEAKIVNNFSMNLLNM